MNWKERFNQTFVIPESPNHYGLDQFGEYIKANPEAVKDFISTEVLNNLINQVCKELDATPEYKEKLIKQWL